MIDAKVRTKSMPVGLGTRFARALFILCWALLFFFTAAGIASFLKLEELSGDDWWFGLLKSGTLAFVVVAGLTHALADWHKKKSAGAFICMLIFFLISASASMNYWYRSMRGDIKTVEVFNLQLDAVVSELARAYDRAESVVKALAALSGESTQKKELEKEHGYTCERQTKKDVEGPRFRFRRDDAALFEGIHISVKSLPASLKDRIAEVQAVKPTAGQLGQALTDLRAASNTGTSVTRDSAWEQAKEKLKKRAADDGQPQKDGKKVFFCADPSIRVQAESAVKRIEELQQIKMPTIEVPDFSKIADSLKIFGLIYDWNSWGKPGGLSISDGIAFAIAIIVEITMARSAGAFVNRLAGDSVLDRLPSALDHDPALTLAVVRALGDDPDPKVLEVMSLIERNERKLFGFRRLVVLYGSEDPDQKRLAWNAPIMKEMDLIEQDSFIFSSLRVRVSLSYFLSYLFSGKYYRRIELFRIKDESFDKIRMREFIARVRDLSPNGPSSEPPRQDNTVPWLQAAE